MSKRVDQALFDQLLAAYREDPGNISAAATKVGVTRETARKAWHQGWPSKPWGVKPISAIIDEDRELARARLEHQAELEELQEDREALDAERDRERARQHAIKVLEHESLLVDLARGVTVAAMQASVKVVAGLTQAMGKLGHELETIATQGKALSMKEVGQISSIMRRFSSTQRDLAAAGQMALVMERLRLGEPTTIVGVQTEYDSMPLDDLTRLCGYQDKVLKRAQARGLIALDGGLSKSVIDAQAQEQDKKSGS